MGNSAFSPAINSGKIVDIKHFTNSTRTTFAEANVGTIWTIPYEKLKADTNLVFFGTLYVHGNGGSGTTCATVKYGSGATKHNGIQLAQTAAADWIKGLGVAGHIEGHNTTGLQNLVFGWDYGNSTNSRPFEVLNPNSSDVAASSTMESVLTIMEVTP